MVLAFVHIRLYTDKVTITLSGLISIQIFYGHNTHGGNIHNDHI